MKGQPFQFFNEKSGLEAQRSQVQAQAQKIENLKQQLQLQNATLQQHVSRLETLVGTQLKIAEGAAASAGTQ